MRWHRSFLGEAQASYAEGTARICLPDEVQCRGTFQTVLRGAPLGLSWNDSTASSRCLEWPFSRYLRLGVEVAEVALLNGDESCLFLVDFQLDLTDGTVAVLLNENLGDTVALSLVHFVVAMNEHDDGCGPLGCPPVSEIRQTRPPPR